MDAQEIVNCVSALSGLDIAVSLGTQAFRRVSLNYITSSNSLCQFVQTSLYPKA